MAARPGARLSAQEEGENDAVLDKEEIVEQARLWGEVDVWRARSGLPPMRHANIGLDRLNRCDQCEMYLKLLDGCRECLAELDRICWCDTAKTYDDDDDDTKCTSHAK